jgi:hypothetical protein
MGCSVLPSYLSPNFSNMADPPDRTISAGPISRGNVETGMAHWPFQIFQQVKIFQEFSLQKQKQPSSRLTGCPGSTALLCLAAHLREESEECHPAMAGIPCLDIPDQSDLG